MCMSMYQQILKIIWIKIELKFLLIMKDKIFFYMIACNCVILFQSFIFVDLYVVIYTDSCSVTIKAVRLTNMKI